MRQAWVLKLIEVCWKLTQFEGYKVMDRLVGLCAQCQFVRQIKNDRESVFYFCERSKTDTQFVKYPSLPLMACKGFVERLYLEDK